MDPGLMNSKNKPLIVRLWKFILIAIKGEEKDFITGDMDRAIFLLSIPMILEMAMESLFAVVDVFFVARISVDAVATVGLTEAVVMLVYSLAIGLSMATTGMIARRIGERDFVGAANGAVQAMILAICVALVVGFVGLFFAEDILRLMGGSESLVQKGVGYTRIMLMGNITIMLLFLLNAVFRSSGDASLAMRSLWLANGLNIILDPCFIFGLGPFPELGVQGAAVATNIGRGSGIVFQLFILFGGKGLIKIGWENVKVNGPVLRRLFNLSVGGVSQYLIGSASWIFLVRIISIFGSEVVAGYTIAFRIIMFTILPSWGMSMAAATLVGQNLGAAQPERAEKSVWKCALYNMSFLLAVSLLFGYFAREFVMLFSSQPEVVKYGAMSLRYICFGYVFFAYGMVINQAFNGAGDTKTPTVISLISYWLFQIPFAYVAAVSWGWGPEGVFLTVAISISIYALISIHIFRKGRWKTVQV
jgi:putative MATE family efflux protein